MTKVIKVSINVDDGIPTANWTGIYGEKVILGMVEGTSMATFETVVGLYMQAMADDAEGARSVPTE